MKTLHPVGPILASLALVLVGCEAPTPAEPAAKVEKQDGPSSISTAEPPIEPSPVPSLLSTPGGDLDKKDEAKPESKQADQTPKPEPHR